MHSEGFIEENLIDEPDDIISDNNVMSKEEQLATKNGELLPMSTCKTFKCTLRNLAESNGVGRNGITNIEDILTEDNTINERNTLSSHDSTRAISFHTLMHLTNALVTHFTYAFWEVDWPKRFSKNHKFN